jgi:hypothetical protein
MPDFAHVNQRESRWHRRLLASIFVLGVALPSVGAATAQTATAQTESSFTCEATALRATAPVIGTQEFSHANADGGACENDFQQVLGISPDDTGGLVGAGVLTAQTTAAADSANAQAEVVGAQVNIPGAGTLTASVLGSNATARCENGSPVFEGDSHIVRLAFGDQVLDIATPANTTIPLSPVLVVVINQQTTETSGDDTVFTVRALHVTSEALGVDVVVAESIVDTHGNPCAAVQEQRFPGWMTGGGFVAEPPSKQDKDGAGVVTPGEVEHHAFSMDCFFPTGDDPGRKDHLQVSWTDDSGERGRFRMLLLQDARCTSAGDPTPPRSNFNTMEGEGVGLCRTSETGNVEFPAEIRFRLTDNGEPGRLDTAEFHVSSPAEAAPVLCDLDSNGNLDGGNHQAHQTREQFNTAPSG